MHNLAPDRLAIEQAVMLLNDYSFDLDGYMVEQLVQEWVQHYQPRWVRLAIIEALYQGRYKAISVIQILAFWERRRDPLCHFNREFEQMVCGRLMPQLLPDAIASPLPHPESSSSSPIDALQPDPKPSSLLVDAAADSTTDNPALENGDDRGDVIVEPIPMEDAALENATDSGIDSIDNGIDSVVSPSPSPPHSHMLSSAPIATSSALPKHPIHQFTPLSDRPDFSTKLYTKLKAVAAATKDCAGQTEDT